MYHFFVTANQVVGDQIYIEGADVNHIKNVLRMKVKEKMQVSDGNNVVYTCEISDFLDTQVLLQILDKNVGENELSTRLILFQGIPKGDKMETIIQKAVELGAYEVVPVKMKRCVAKIEPKKEEAKIKRFQMISESAAKQAGRNIIPEVKNVMTLKGALNYARTMNHILLPYELATDMNETKEILKSISANESVAIFIGPEGGFDKEEVDFLVSEGAKVVTLGKRILRTETAGMTLLSVLMFQLS